MWFNHSTAIFAPKSRKRSAGKTGLSSALRPLDRHLLDDLGVSSGLSFNEASDLSGRVVHESRFVGFRGGSH